ncbi:activating transcription factor 7 interacting protein 2 [Nelusetta ayraudi]|uniref:activating transcription factor 7 interacting protein 2 n=1 Tax=Nelusetta ayraudi TaxID=303726 RepID=UPI003F706A12
MSQNPAKQLAKASTKPRQHKTMSTLKHRNRVTIGGAFERWHEWKSKKGLKSDEAVAICLLEEAKTSRSSSLPSPSTSSSKRMKFSKSDVQMMIKREVNSALKENEDKLQSLIETVQQLDSEADYESCLQNLETRINIITQRAEAAFACVPEKKSTVSCPTVSEIFGTDSEEEDESNSLCTDNSSELSRAEENVQVALRTMRADKEALTAAAAHQDEEAPPSLFAPRRSPKVESVQKQQPKPSPKEQKDSENAKREDALARKGQQQDNSVVPPLPLTAVPSTLTVEAASYNFPQKVQVYLAFIRKPPGLSLLWKVAEADPSAPPMDSYSIYISMEKDKGSSAFSDWTVIGEVKALPLPMCIMINKYKPGRKLCFAVVGKDVFGRYGPYSEVAVAEKIE